MGGSSRRGERTDRDEPVSKAVVSRLSLYLRELQQLIRDGQETISSTQLGALLGFTDAQVRKDLATFGQFGHPGIGYRCHELIPVIRTILGTSESWRVALLGVGNLGRALVGYKGFRKQGFELVAGFDLDPNQLETGEGQQPSLGGGAEAIPIYPISELATVVRQQGIRMAMLAVPAAAAQSVADQAVAAGIDGILNFAPVTLNLPEHVRCIGVDLAIELEQLAFAVVNNANKA
ncbi:MAG: redox-sensing transcriptional repressor Rex [Planctomycetales bacterium]|nr:redox-sensing transcriptional repressor Rex [Planctomycetales bacterium]